MASSGHDAEKGSGLPQQLAHAERYFKVTMMELLRCHFCLHGGKTHIEIIS